LVVKIGDLEREYQVWRDRGDPRKGTGSGPDTWFGCTRCGDVIPSDAPPEVRDCGCGNIHAEAGRLVVDDWDDFVVLATSSCPPDPS
jgi:hypothetical protein